MANWTDPKFTGTGQAGAGYAGAQTRGAEFDAGLRSYMLSIYNYMTSGVLLTGIVALVFAQSGMAAQVFVNGGILAWVIMLSPLAIVFAMSFGQNRFSEGTLKAMFWGYAALMGLSLSTIFLVYTGASIAVTFFATAAAFAASARSGPKIT